jgi:heat shock protein HtpX
MISALRKIEGRGELAGATSAVMEMCIDNPREGFENLFDTHPSVANRVAALVRYAGGHDPGPLSLPDAERSPWQSQDTADPDAGQGTMPQVESPKPFLPAEPPVSLGTPAESPTPNQPGGPWGRPPSR